LGRLLEEGGCMAGVLGALPLMDASGAASALAAVGADSRPTHTNAFYHTSIILLSSYFYIILISYYLFSYSY
jgi:hypothetical protein